MINNELDRPHPEPAPDLQDLINSAIRLQEQGMNVIPLRPITPPGKAAFPCKGRT